MAKPTDLEQGTLELILKTIWVEPRHGLLGDRKEDRTGFARGTARPAKDRCTRLSIVWNNRLDQSRMAQNGNGPNG
jgi:hypothetical protein